MKQLINTMNPVLTPDTYIPDAEGHVIVDGKLFIFGSEDRSNTANCSKEYIAASTSDLKHWTVYDPIFDSRNINWDGDGIKYPGGVDWSKPSPYLKQMFENDKKNGRKIDYDNHPTDWLYAPDVIEKDGKFYLYFCLSDDSEGVAVANRPEGPYENPTRLHVNGIDPSVFIDDDGQAYLYWGQFYSHAAKLNPDMISIDESTIYNNVLTEDEHHFHEGSSVRKIGDTYYYLFTSISNGKPTSLDYATGKTPFGPFTYQGTIINNDGCNPNNWNNHGSICEFNNKWYVFYHRSSQGKVLHRRLCIEPIAFDKNGLIQEVPMTSQGVGNSLGEKRWVSFYRACNLLGSGYLSPTSDGNEDWINLQKDDVSIFKYFKFQTEINNLRIDGDGSCKAMLNINGKNYTSSTLSNGQMNFYDLHISPNEQLTISFKILNANPKARISKLYFY